MKPRRLEANGKVISESDWDKVLEDPKTQKVFNDLINENRNLFTSLKHFSAIRVANDKLVVTTKANPPK